MNPFRDKGEHTWVYVLLLIVAIIGVAFLRWWEVNTQVQALQAITNTAITGSQAVLGNTYVALDKMNEHQMERTQLMNEQAKHKARLASISGCTTNAKRDNCKCFDKSGSVESILDQQQCLAVVDRGLAALQDY